MQGKNALDAFTVRDTPYGKCLIQPAAFAANYYARKYLDSFLVALHNPRVNTDRVAHFERVRVGFVLLFFDGTDGLVHNDFSLRYRARNIDLWVCAPSRVALC